MGQREARAGAGRRVVGPRAVGDHDAVVAAEHLPGRFVRAAGQGRVRHLVVAGHLPRPPAFFSGLRASATAPPGFIGAAHRRGQHVRSRRSIPLVGDVGATQADRGTPHASSPSPDEVSIPSRRGCRRDRPLRQGLQPQVRGHGRFNPLSSGMSARPRSETCSRRSSSLS